MSKWETLQDFARFIGITEDDDKKELDIFYPEEEDASSEELRKSVKENMANLKPDSDPAFREAIHRLMEKAREKKGVEIGESFKKRDEELEK